MFSNKHEACFSYQFETLTENAKKQICSYGSNDIKNSDCEMLNFRSMKTGRSARCSLSFENFVFSSSDRKVQYSKHEIKMDFRQCIIVHYQNLIADSA